MAKFHYIEGSGRERGRFTISEEKTKSGSQDRWRLETGNGFLFFMSEGDMEDLAYLLDESLAWLDEQEGVK